MRLPLVAIVTLALAAPLSAQQPAASKKTEDAPKPKIVAPAPTPAPKKSMLGRIFGGKAKPTPAPAPTPAPTPAPAPVVKPKPRPKPKAKPAPETTEPAETKAEKEKPKAEAEKPKDEAGKPAPEAPKAEEPKTEPAKPEGETPKPADVEAQKPKSGKTGKGGKNAAKTPPKPVEEVKLDDATKYKNARTKALEDEQVKELKSKADSAIAEDEAHRASVNYNKALFRKIRQVDPSIDTYVDKLEEAMNKRLSAEKREQ